MSALIVPVLAASAFAAVPPSFGSEPYVLDFEQVAPPAHTRVVAGDHTLQASLGSEPFLIGAANMPAANANASAVAQPGGPVTLATSLGSEPFILTTPEENATPAVARAQTSSDERMARNCTCK